MQLIKKNIIFFLFSVLWVSAAEAEATVPVSPGQRFPSALLDVRAPVEDGWELIRNEAMLLVFRKDGASADESDVAQVMLFPVPQNQTTDQFIAFIQDAVKSDVKTGHLTLLDPKFEYTEKRGYPCVRFTGLTVAAEAASGLFNRQSQRSQVRSLYCLHPSNKRLGFLAGFTHRGRVADAAFAVRADEFAAGVKVPDATKN